MEHLKLFLKTKSKLLFISLSVVFLAPVSLIYFIGSFSRTASHVAQKCGDIAQACYQATTPYSNIFDSPLKLLAITFLGFVIYALIKFVFSLAFLFVHESKISGTRVRSSRVKDVLQKLKMQDLKVVILKDDRPIAYTYGLTRPKVCLSSKIIDILDDNELEAVILHEAAHVYKRDNIWVLLITFIKDSLTFMPLSKLIYRLFRREKEYEADDFAIMKNADSLGLASAIIKISKFKNNLHVPYGALAFSETKIIEDRVKRLLNGSHRPSLYPKNIVISLILSLIILFSLVGFGYALPKNSTPGNSCGMASGCDTMKTNSCT